MAATSFVGGLVLFVVSALPVIGALRLVPGPGNLWILAAASLMLLGIAQVLHYASRLQDGDEMGEARLATAGGNALVSPGDVHFDLALKQFLLASRHQHQLGCIAIDIDEGSLRRLSNETGRGVAFSPADTSTLGLAAMMTAEVTRRSDLTLKGPGPGRLIVLCPETGWSGAVHVAQKVERVLRRELALEVRFGVAAFPGDAFSLTELLRRAEWELQQPDGTYDSRQLIIEFPGWGANGELYVDV